MLWLVHFTQPTKRLWYHFQCHKSPFARVSKAWVHADQSIPDNIQKRIVRRDGAPPPQVKGLSLDTKFSNIDPKIGNINLLVQGSNVPDVNDQLQFTSPNITRRQSRHLERGIFGDIANKVGDVASDVGDTVEKGFDKLNSFSKDVNKTLPPVNVKKNFPLLDLSKPCPGVDGKPGFGTSLKADIDVDAHASISIGVVAKGTVVPPKISDFGVFAGTISQYTTNIFMLTISLLGLDASINGALNMVGSASVSRMAYLKSPLLIDLDSGLHRLRKEIDIWDWHSWSFHSWVSKLCPTVGTYLLRLMVNELKGS